MKLLRKLFAMLPHKLPQGMAEFETWAKSIIDIYEMPDNDSIRFALATAIMHLPATASHRPRAYFGAILIKGAASQVANQVFYDMKLKQQIKAEEEAKAAKEAADKQAAEATATPEVAPNVEQQKT
jgi:hypothetical protein